MAKEDKSEFFSDFFKGKVSSDEMLRRFRQKAESAGIPLPDDLEEKIKDYQTKAAENIRQTGQDAAAFRDEIQRLIRNSRDGNGRFSQEYFTKAAADTEKRIRESELKEFDKVALLSLLSTARSFTEIAEEIRKKFS